MKITDYSYVRSFNDDDVFLIDGADGTRIITVADAILAALHMSSVHNHRNFIRGKNLGNTLTTEQKAAIQTGSFDDLWLGDYWEINGVKWRIVDFDYWYGSGNVSFISHHLTIMPDEPLFTAAMNATSVTTGGYVSSQMKTSSLASAETIVTNAFGSALLSHREYLINEVTGEIPTAGGWYDSTVELPNEPMMYGSYISTVSDPGSKLHTNSKTQLALFSAAPIYIRCETAQNYWLRDVASATAFASVSSFGAAHLMNAANEAGVRPVFAIG